MGKRMLTVNFSLFLFFFIFEPNFIFLGLFLQLMIITNFRLPKQTDFRKDSRDQKLNIMKGKMEFHPGPKIDKLRTIKSPSLHVVAPDEAPEEGAPKPNCTTLCAKKIMALPGFRKVTKDEIITLMPDIKDKARS